MRTLLLLAVLLAILPAFSQTKQTEAADTLQQQLHTLAAAHHGQVALYGVNLQTGAAVGLDPDHVVQTASVIKLAILYEALEQLRTGEVHWGDRLVLRSEDRVPGSGVLHLLDAPLTLTLKDVLTLMIALSDNAATDLAIDTLGLERIDRRLVALGLSHTYLYKKVFLPVTPGTVLPDDFKLYGLGKTTPREMVTLMTRLVRCELGGAPRAGDAALCATAASMLQEQFTRTGIPRYLTRLPGATDTSIANKTGALEAVRNDVAAISTRKGMVVLAEFTFANADRSWGEDQEAELTLGRLARAVVAAWSPEGLSSWPAPDSPAWGRTSPRP